MNSQVVCVCVFVYTYIIQTYIHTHIISQWSATYFYQKNNQFKINSMFKFLQLYPPNAFIAVFINCKCAISTLVMCY